MRLFYTLQKCWSACGITIFGNFSENSYGRFDFSGLSKDHLKKYNCIGAGFAMASFIDSKECKEAYKILKEKYEILYESPKRINANSNNEFFFCIYDTSSMKEETNV